MSRNESSEGGIKPKFLGNLWAFRCLEVPVNCSVVSRDCCSYANLNIFRLPALSREHLTTQDIDLVILSNGDPDSMANFNLFSDKPLLYGVVEMSGEKMTTTVLTQVGFQGFVSSVENNYTHVS